MLLDGVLLPCCTISIPAGGVKAFLLQAPVRFQVADDAQVLVELLLAFGQGLLAVDTCFAQGFQLGLAPGQLGGVLLQGILQRLPLGLEHVLLPRQAVVLHLRQRQRHPMQARLKLLVPRGFGGLPFEAAHALFDLLGQVA